MVVPRFTTRDVAAQNLVSVSDAFNSIQKKNEKITDDDKIFFLTKLNLKLNLNIFHILKSSDFRCIKNDQNPLFGSRKLGQSKSPKLINSFRPVVKVHSLVQKTKQRVKA